MHRCVCFRHRLGLFREIRGDWKLSVIIVARDAVAYVAFRQEDKTMRRSSVGLLRP